MSLRVHRLALVHIVMADTSEGASDTISSEMSLIGIADSSSCCRCFFCNTATLGLQSVRSSTDRDLVDVLLLATALVKDNHSSSVLGHLELRLELLLLIMLSQIFIGRYAMEYKRIMGAALAKE